MSRRTRPLTAWVRIVHRWISMAFVVAAAVLILPILPAGPVLDAGSAIAIVLLVLLLISGVWMAVHHYATRARAATRRARRTTSVA